MERRFIGGQSLWRLSRQFRQGNWNRSLIDGSFSRLEQATAETKSSEKYRLLNICLATRSWQALPFSVLEDWSAQLLQRDWKSPWNSPDAHLAAMLCTCLLIVEGSNGHQTGSDTDTAHGNDSNDAFGDTAGNDLVNQLSLRLLQKYARTLRKYPLVLGFMAERATSADHSRKLDAAITLSQHLHSNTVSLTDYLTANAIKSISVVGNAPSLIKQREGKIIDNADCVIRFNNVVITPERAASTGQRTDIHVCNPGFRSRRAGKKLASFTPEAKTIWLSSYLPYKRPGKYWQELAKLNAETRTSYLESDHAIWLKLVQQCEAPPTAGLLALSALAATECEINAYGFSLLPSINQTSNQTTNQTNPSRKNRQPINGSNHYGDKAKKSSRHNWLAESECLKKLSQHRVNMHL